MFVFDSFIFLSFVRMKLETITSEDNPDEVDTSSHIPLLTFTKNRLIEFSPLFQETESREPAPRPPPRYKRKVKMRGVENLNLENMLSREASVEDSHQNDILFNVFSKTGKSGDVVKGLIKSLNERPASNNNESLLLKKHLLFSSATLITNTFIESAIPVNHKERYLEIILLQTLSIILLDYYSSKHSKFQRIFFSNAFIFYFLENISLMH